MANKQFTDFAQTTLSSPCTNVAATLSVVSVAGWPTVGDFWLRIDDPSPATTFEWAKVTSVNVAGNQVTVVRGENGTTGIAHGAGAFVSNKIPAIALPWGVLARVVLTTTDQTGVSTEVAITGMTATVVIGTNRIIRLSTALFVSGTVAEDAGLIIFKEGATGLTQLKWTVDNSDKQKSVSGFCTLTPTGGSHTYSLDVARAAGTGTMSVFERSGLPAEFLIEDLGPV